MASRIPRNKKRIGALVALILAIGISAYSAAGYAMVGSLTGSRLAAAVYGGLTIFSALVAAVAAVVLIRSRRPPSTDTSHHDL